MSFSYFVELYSPESVSIRMNSHSTLEMQEYVRFRDRLLVESEADFFWVNQGDPLRKKLLDIWGISALSELEPILTLRGENIGEENIKMVNEKIYSMGGGIYLCHRWRGVDHTCGWQQGDMELVKFSPQLELIFHDWVEKMRDPVY